MSSRRPDVVRVDARLLHAVVVEREKEYSRYTSVFKSRYWSRSAPSTGIFSNAGPSVHSTPPPVDDPFCLPLEAGQAPGLDQLTVVRSSSASRSALTILFWILARSVQFTAEELPVDLHVDRHLVEVVRPGRHKP